MSTTSTTSSLGPVVIAVLWTMMAVAAVLFFARSYAASFRSGRPRWDYIWIFLSCATALIAAAFVNVGVNKGLGSRIATLELQQIWDSIYWFFMAVYFGAASIMFSKFAVIALLLDVYKGSGAAKRRQALWFIGFAFAVTTTLEIFLTAFQCTPNSRLWDLTVPGECKYAIAARVIGYTHASVGAITDIILALWPISIVWNLNASRQIKISICVLMGLGVIPGIAALIRIELLVRLYASTDPTYDSGLLIMSAGIETGMLIIVGCIPPLRPLFSKLFKGLKMNTSYGNTGAATNHNTNGGRPRSFKPTRSTEPRLTQDGLRGEVKELPSSADGAGDIVVKHSYQIDTSDAPSGEKDQAHSFV